MATRTLPPFPAILSDADSVLLQQFLPGSRRQAAHVAFMAKEEGKEKHHVMVSNSSLDDGPAVNPWLFQMLLREDGTFGFPGGFVEEGETVVEGLNRETKEEIGADLSVQDGDFVCGHLKKHPHYGDLELHFYAKEIALDDYKKVEREFTAAEHFGVEVRKNKSSLMIF